MRLSILLTCVSICMSVCVLWCCRGDEEEGAIASPLQQRITAHKQVKDNGQHYVHTCRGFRFLRNSDTDEV